MPWKDKPETCSVRTNARIEVTESIREWDYGDYEGKTSKTIREEREKSGIDSKWDIWSEGCPGGEYAETRRQAIFTTNH